MKRTMSFAMLFLAGTLAAQEQAGKSPVIRSDQQPAGSVSVGTTAAWSLTDEERIERRFKSLPQNPHMRSSSIANGYQESIDGRTRPELLLPYELFDALIGGVSGDPKREANAHMLFDPKIRAVGYDVDGFWAAVRGAAQPYLTSRAVHHQQHQRSTLFTTPAGETIFVPIQHEVCVARFRALQEARRLLGGKDFDRFLYMAVAPEVGISAGGNGANRPAQLRYMAAGCQARSASAKSSR